MKIQANASNTMPLFGKITIKQEGFNDEETQKIQEATDSTEVQHAGADIPNGYLLTITPGKVLNLSEDFTFNFNSGVGVLTDSMLIGKESTSSNFKAYYPRKNQTISWQTYLLETITKIKNQLSDIEEARTLWPSGEWISGLKSKPL